MNRILIGLSGLLVFLLGCSAAPAELPPPAVGVVDTSDVTESPPTLVPTVEAPTATAEPEPTEDVTELVEITPVSPTATAVPDPTATAEPAVTAEVAELPGYELYTFAADEPGWYTVDDSVMGGVSNSTVERLDDEFLYFSGNMSLDNNGGFSSVRSDWTEIDLTGADGILLRVKGDGQVYRLRIRTASAGSGISYNALFRTEFDTWTIVYVPFADMVPTYRGFVMDVEALNPATIGSFGFMLSDKQPGQFELLVDWMRVVTDAELEDAQG